MDIENDNRSLEKNDSFSLRHSHFYNSWFWKFSMSDAWFRSVYLRICYRTWSLKLQKSQTMCDGRRQRASTAHKSMSQRPIDEWEDSDLSPVAHHDRVTDQKTPSESGFPYFGKTPTDLTSFKSVSATICNQHVLSLWNIISIEPSITCVFTHVSLDKQQNDSERIDFEDPNRIVTENSTQWDSSRNRAAFYVKDKT